MKFFAALHRRFQWLNLPGALLLMLLQRTPMLRIFVSAENAALRAPAGALLKSTVAVLGALGALHSRAGATELVTNVNSPLRATVGTAITTVAFGLSGTQTNPSSWSVSGSLPPGLTLNGRGSLGTFSGSNLTLAGTPTTAGSYTLAISGSDAGFESPTFSYTVTVTGGVTNAAPTFTTQPAAQTVTAGANVTFSVAVDGSPAPTLQWRKDGTALTGQTGSTLTLTNVQSANAGTYTCVATNSVGTATSNGAILTVNPVAGAPVITVQPLSATATLGSNVTFTVAATGAATQQWRKNGTAIAGATSTTFTLTSITAAAAGDYDVVLTNATGSASVTSGTATLLISAGLTSRLSNVSVLTTLAANQILTVGLTMQGGAKPVLLRAAGPGLGALGVPGTMADPKLALFNGSTQVVANDNWAGDAAVASAISRLGAFPFQATTSLDAALVATFEGGRTAQVSGPAAGTMIVEAYDAADGNTTRLTNISALNFVGPGSPLVAGFTVAGTGTKNLLIRAAGPSLGALGVPGTLVDPKLVLLTSGQAPVAENDTYAPTLTEVFRSVGAFAFVPGAKDAAIIISLPAGGYTVTVSGADGGSGSAIVEIYELP